MSTTNVLLPSFLGGISQQADAIRDPALFEDAENVEFLPSEGCSKRLPTQHIAQIEDASLGARRCIFMERDDADFVIAVGNADVKVYSTDGTQQPILSTSQSAPFVPDFSYLTGAEFKDLRYQTIADAAYILNRKVKTAGSAGKGFPSWYQPTSGVDAFKGEAGISVIQSNFDTLYSVTIKTTNMTEPFTVTYTTPDKAESLIAASRIANQVHQAGQIAGTQSFSLSGNGDFNTGGVDFKFNSIDDLTIQEVVPSTSATIDLDSTDFVADPVTLQLFVKDATVLTAGLALRVEREASNLSVDVRQETIARRLIQRLGDHFDGSSSDRPLITFEGNSFEFDRDNFANASFRISFQEAIEKLEVKDSENNAFIKGWTDRVELLSDLPRVFKHGAVVNIAGENSSNSDDLFVEFQSDEWVRVTDSDTDRFNEAQFLDVFGRGVWSETTKRGQESGVIDASTMPHLLQRKIADATVAAGSSLSEGDFYWDWNEEDWGDRITGSEETSETPSFIGSTISDVYFHQNRLGFLSENSVILSETGQSTNFWRTTIQAVVDSDPIDVVISGLDGDTLRHAIEFTERLIVFSDEGQSAVFGTPLLSPKTVEAPVLSAYRCLQDLMPVRLGQSVFFAETNGEFAHVREYFPGDERQQVQDFLVTTAVPRLVPRSVRKLVTGSVHQMVAALSDSPNEVIVYQFQRSNQSLLQASWTRWTFPSADILDAGFIQDELFLVVERDGRTFLEKIQLGVGRSDTDEDFAIRADRLAVPQTPTYSLLDDTTAWSIPYGLGSTDDLVLVAGSTGDIPFGSEILIESATPGFPLGLIKARGDLTGQSVYVGLRYNARVVMSKATPKLELREGRTALLGGSTTIRHLLLNLTNTGYLKATTTYVDGESSVDEFLDGVVGVGSLESTEVRDGVFKIPVHADPDEFQITLENDSPLPSTLVSGAWGTRFNSRNRIR